MRFTGLSITLALTLAILGCDSEREKPAPLNTGGIDAAASKITFVGSKDEGKHNGGFKTLTGSVTFDAAALDKAAISVEIDATSLWSDDDKLTGHLKGADFFDVNAQPKAGFKSTLIEKTGEAYTLTGDLTIKGKTNKITAPATITSEGGKTTIKTSFKINRFDYGIDYGKGQVHDEVSIAVELVTK
ncbi:MAG: YceI family protein [Phycisphaeraceae bacterium]